MELTGVALLVLFASGRLERRAEERALHLEEVERGRIQAAAARQGEGEGGRRLHGVAVPV